jgi:23S rRNA (adenine2030-N6)-methyltransferase
MNYRHAFHAGNFADVFKHILLTRILLYLMRKEAPFRYLDSHAGSGVYNLAGEAARRSGEAEGGVRRFLEAPLEGAAEALAQPYRDLVAPLVGGEERYPGSPEIAARLVRPGDRMTLVELEPGAVGALQRRYQRDRRATLIAGDAYEALPGLLPPVERRGLVLVDPPFERPDEFRSMHEGVTKGLRRWATGIFALWYPIKNDGLSERFLAALRGIGIEKLLVAELRIARATELEGGLFGCGLAVFNPPFVLAEECEALLPALTLRLQTGRGSFRIEAG